MLGGVPPPPDIHLGVTMTWQEPQDDPDWRDAYGDYGQHGTAGQAPYGQQYGQDPYAQYAQDPYGQQQYGQAYYGQHGQYASGSYGPPGVQRANTGLTVAALVANIVSAVLCCGIGLAWIPGVVLSAIALNRANSDPESTRRLTLIAWACFVADVILTVVAFAVIGVLSDDHGSNSY
jgi:hypothetical protein